MSGILGVGSKSGIIGKTELDYEEGSWTPTVDSGTMSGATGVYTKIGNRVSVKFNLANFSDKTTDQIILIGSLPFTLSGGGGTVQTFQVNHAEGTNLTSYSSTGFRMTNQYNPSSWASIKYSELGSDPNFGCNATYFT